jgi:hypothetical protein
VTLLSPATLFSRVMTAKRLGALAIVAAGVAVSMPSYAADAPNYGDLFRAKALKCIHPTLNVDKATVEILKGPTTAGEITTVRVKAYYEGWLKKNVMESDIMVRQAGSIRQMMVKVLADSGSAHKKCDLEDNWKDF